MANPVTYNFSTWEPDATGADTNHPQTLVDPMNAGSSNDAAGWVRLIESNMRNQAVNKQWEYWLGINAPYSPSPNAPAYTSTTQFTLTGDWTVASPGFYPAIAIVGRRVKAYTTANPSPVGVTGTISGVSFATGQTTVTVVWDGTGIDSSLSEVQFGVPIPGGASPSFPATYWGEDVTNTNSYVVSVASPGGITPVSLASLQGQIIVVGIAKGNAGAATINVNGFGVEPIQKGGGVALTGGEIGNGQWIALTWTSGSWQLLNPNPPTGGGGFVTAPLAGITGMPNSTLVTLITLSLTVPSGAATYRLLANYAIAVSSSAAAFVDFELTDGSYLFGFTEIITPSGISGGGSSASGTSPVTYARGASVTLTLKGQSNSAGTVQALQTSLGPLTWASYLSALFVPSA